MEFRESVLRLLSNKISESDRKELLEKMETKAKEELAFTAYMVYYYNEIQHDHEKSHEFEALLKGKDLKRMAETDADLAYVVALFVGTSIYFDENIAEMQEWFALSSKNGNPLADFEMGFYHYQIAIEGEKKHSKKEFEKAITYFTKVKNAGLVEGTLALAELYIENDDVDNATKMFNDAIEKNDSDGYLGLALIEYDNKNYKKAKDFLLKSFNLDKNRVASFYLGGMYFEEKNVEEGLKYFEESANQGNFDAMFDLGVLYMEGEVVKADEKKAFDYFKVAAEYGDAGAQFYLGVFYKEGKVVAQNDKQARYWLESAAEQEDEDAIEMLNSF